jgi:predicted oxidoreductase
MTDFKLSKLVFGTWRLADKASADPKDILNRIKTCIDLGITSFDLADIYGLYTYEKLFGQALKLEPSIRSKIQIITKFDILINCPVFPDVKVHHYDTSKEYIFQAAERSLKEIGIDYIDLLLIHRPDPLMNADEVAAAFKKLKEQGKVRHFGVSNFTPSQFELLQSRLDFPLVTNQVEFSVMQPAPMYDGTFDQLQRLKVQPMIWSPLAGGKLFTDKSEQTVRVVKALEKVGKELGPDNTIDQVAFAWIMRHPVDSCIVLGTNDLARIKKAVDSMKLKLTREQWFYILEACNGCEVP